MQERSTNPFKALLSLLFLLRNLLVEGKDGESLKNRLYQLSDSFVRRYISLLFFYTPKIIIQRRGTGIKNLIPKYDKKDMENLFAHNFIFSYPILKLKNDGITQAPKLEIRT